MYHHSCKEEASLMQTSLIVCAKERFELRKTHESYHKIKSSVSKRNIVHFDRKNSNNEVPKRPFITIQNGLRHVSTPSTDTILLVEEDWPKIHKAEQEMQAER